MKINPKSEGEEMIGDFLFDLDIDYKDDVKILNLKHDDKQCRMPAKV